MSYIITSNQDRTSLLRQFMPILFSLIRPNPTSSVPQRGTEGGTQGTHVPMTSSGLKAKREEHASQDSLSSSPKSTDSLNMRPSGDRPREIQHSVQSGKQTVQQKCSLRLNRIHTLAFL